MCKNRHIQRNLFKTICLKILNIYLYEYFAIFNYTNVHLYNFNYIIFIYINILQYFDCNEILEIFVTCFCNILCSVDY